MALGQPSVQSNQNQGEIRKYLRPNVKADRDIINHIWTSINDLHNRAMEGQVSIRNLDDFADYLRQDYGVRVDIVGEGNNFRFSQVGSSKTSTGAHLSRHIEKITGEADNTIPSITGQYICEQFGTAFARRSDLERQSPSPTRRVVRTRQPAQLGGALPPTTIGETDGFDDRLDDLSEDDEGGLGEDGFIETDTFLSEPSVHGDQSPAVTPSQLFYLDVDAADDLPGERPFGEPSTLPAGRVNSAQLGTPESRPSDVAQLPRAPRNGQGLGRDPTESTVSDAASTFSGLANGDTDGVTVMADAGELMAVAAAATMLGIEAVKQIRQGANPLGV